jgi:uncharacterized membrane protein
MQMPATTPALPEPRAVSAGRGTEWIAQGFGLFRLQPGAWIGILLLWIVINAVLGSVHLEIANSFLNPIFLAGMMLGCDSQARGERLKVGHLFAAFQSGAATQLLLMTLWTWLLACLLLIPLVALIGWPLFGAWQELDNPTPEQFLQAVGLGKVLLVALGAAAIGLVIAMVVWFAPALIVFRKLAAIDALKLSFRGCQRSWLAFAVYGLVTALMFVLAVIPLGLGLLIAIPVLIASIYASYRDIYPA